MDTQSLWLVILSLSTPIAGLVGFAIQLRNVKKSRLENEKLQLEIAALKAAADKQGSRIVIASTKEVLDISHADKPAFSRSHMEARGEPHRSKARRPIQTFLLALLVYGLIAVFLSYLIFDIYRLFAFLVEWLF